MATLIKAGTLVTDTDTCAAEILIRDGKIAAVGRGLQAPDAEIIDSSGKLIFPGGV